MFGLFDLCAKLFHVSFVIIPFNGGIPWDSSRRLTILFLLGVISTIYFYLKSRKQPPSIK